MLAKDLATLVLKTMPTGLECNQFHHAKKDQHFSSQPCPVLTRWEETVTLLEQLRKEDEHPQK
jgi:hypothetical protein